MKNLAILGSTGSIGRNTLNVVRKFPELYQIKALAAGTNVALLAEQILEFQPELVSVCDHEHAAALQHRLGSVWKGEILHGEEGNIAVASHGSAGFVVSAIVGAAGLLPTLAAIDAGRDVGLANKETLVMAGRIVMERARAKHIRIYPIDSEHSAIFQSLESGRVQDVRKIILTASGGPFFGKTKSFLQKVCPEQALRHPNWPMGQKITIDSATMMNKGLEVIEARWLFGMGTERIAVCIHPQSVIHSMVEYQDGSVIAQLGVPDMITPIAYALSYPKRLSLQMQPLSLTEYGSLSFFEPDTENFPALRLAYDVLEAGGIAPAVLNAANEVAVAAFLRREIGFLQIVEIVEEVLAQFGNCSRPELAEILDADRRSRSAAQRLIAQKS